MSTEVVYEVSTRPGTDIPSMDRVVLVDGTEINRAMVNFVEVLSVEPSVATNYILAVKAKVDSLSQVFERTSEPTFELFEESSILVQTLNVFSANYSDSMLPPMTI
jgi:hypothetical protein